MEIDRGTLEDFPGIKTAETMLNVSVRKTNPDLDGFKSEVYRKIRTSYTLEGLKDIPIFRAYRDFFWRIGIDPTKIRPSAEALIRRILQGKELPCINTAVDSYNLASVETGISIAGFDASKINGALFLRKAKAGEEFSGIGMDQPILLAGNEIVIEDSKRIVAVYPYRDSEETKITEDTNEAIFIMCGVPGITNQRLVEAKRITEEYVGRFCSLI